MEDPGPYLLSITSVPKSGEPDHCMGLIFESGQQPQVLTSIHHGDGVVVGVPVLKKKLHWLFDNRASIQSSY